MHSFTECQRLPLVPNSKATFVKFGIPWYFLATPGSSVRYKCSENYAMFGNSLIECQDDLSWPEVGTCLPGGVFNYISYFK